MDLNRKLKYGMVGGGPGAFIGEVHRRAAAIDGNILLAAGVFSSDPEKSAQKGRELNLDQRRVYDTYEEMARKEAQLTEGERIDFVSVVTPNHLHFDVCKTFIENKINVVCDKPMTNTVEEAEELCRLVSKHEVIFALTHNYTGYPMVKEARHLVQQGRLGTLRKVVVAYPQGWLSDPVEQEGSKQAVWRTDPNRAGVSSVVADIGSHAENLVEYITGLNLRELYADIHTFVDNRELEDDANMLVHYEEGVRGILYASQISIGEENDFNIRIYGDEAALEWHQENPNYLRIKYPDRPEEIYKRGNAYLSKAAKKATRIPPGHPEGFIEAFANIYANVADAVADRIQGKGVKAEDYDFTTVQDGATGVHFIHKAIESGKERKWVDMQYAPPS